MPSFPMISHLKLIAAGLMLVMMTGCSSLNLPSISMTKDTSVPYVPVGDGVVLSGHESVDVYQKVRQAQHENAVVLEMVGEDEPLRVLPLPPGDQTVFVSTLLEQTGVLAEIGALDARLFRQGAGSIAGVRMEVKMNQDTNSVRPESDYALQAGDRLQVSQREITALNALSSVLGI